MRCNVCNNEIQDGLNVCPMCGSNVSDSNRYNNMNNMNNTRMNSAGMNAPEFILYLVVSIISLVCCCNPIVGVPSIVTTILMNNDYRNGNIESYIKLKKINLWIIIIGYILTLIFNLITFVVSITAGMNM